MPTYRVNLVNVGSFSVEVEAENEEEAFELAFEQAPNENIHTGFDLGEWTFASDLWPGTSKPENDIELLEN